MCKFTVNIDTTLCFSINKVSLHPQKPKVQIKFPGIYFCKVQAGKEVTLKKTSRIMEK